MADLRKRYLEDFAGGILNASLQEVTSVGEILVQNGFLSAGTISIDDGTGRPTGLALGVATAEAIEPSTDTSVVTVKYSNDNYAQIRDLKIFSTSILAVHSALTATISTVMENIERALDLLETDLISSTQSLEKISGQNSTILSRLVLDELTLTDQRDRLIEDIRLMRENNMVIIEKFRAMSVTISETYTHIREIYESYKVNAPGAVIDVAVELETSIPISTRNIQVSPGSASGV